MGGNEFNLPVGLVVFDYDRPFLLILRDRSAGEHSRAGSRELPHLYSLDTAFQKLPYQTMIRNLHEVFQFHLSVRHIH